MNNIQGNFILAVFLKDKIDILKRIFMICFFVLLSIEVFLVFRVNWNIFKANNIILIILGVSFNYIIYEKYLRKIITIRIRCGILVLQYCTGFL